MEDEVGFVMEIWERNYIFVYKIGVWYRRKGVDLTSRWVTNSFSHELLEKRLGRSESHVLNNLKIFHFYHSKTWLQNM